MNSLNCRFIGQFQKGGIIGQGTYGIVFFARDKLDNTPLAIKKMKVLDNQDGFPITSLRQVKILKTLSAHPNIVTLREVVVGLKADSVFLVFEYCEIDLYKLISQMYIDKAYFSEGQIKCLTLQLMKGISYAHSKFIIHRDLKLTNLLLTKAGILKIADFGLARQFERPERPLTRKVVTLWYRAPELLFKFSQYSQAVDTWSIGCILAQMLRKGSPLFQGNSESHQIQLISQMIGMPTKQDWPEVYQSSRVQQLKKIPKGFHGRKNRLSEVIPNASEGCINLLTRMLVWNPQRRLGLSEAMNHSYFQESPKALFPDEIKVLNKLQFYSKRSNQELNKKK